MRKVDWAEGWIAKEVDWLLVSKRRVIGVYQDSLDAETSLRNMDNKYQEITILTSAPKGLFMVGDFFKGGQK